MKYLGQSTSGEETLRKMLFEKMEEARKTDEKFKRDGLCTTCGKAPGDQATGRCQACSEELEGLLKQLRGPGFFEFKL